LEIFGLDSCRLHPVGCFPIPNPFSFLKASIARAGWGDFTGPTSFRDDPSVTALLGDR
jgi:hypothetical protein